MPDDSFNEALEQRVSKIVQDKLGLIRPAILKLKKDQDELASQQKKEMLRTQRLLARIAIENATDGFRVFVKREMPKVFDSFFSKIGTDASAALLKASTSSDPLAIAEKFQSKWQRLIGSATESYRRTLGK